MATFSTANTQVAIDMSDANLVDFNAIEGKATTFWSWITTNADDINIGGTGFTYSGDNATGGDVTNLGIDIGNDQAGASTNDIYITGLSGTVDITELDDSAEDFWDEVLRGNDIVDLTGLTSLIGGTSIIFADDFDTPEALFLGGGSDTGGNDTITGGTGAMDVMGDVFTVDGSFSTFAFITTYTGGNDTMTAGAGTITASRFSGDAWTVGSYATLNGGDDIIDISANSWNASSAIGDAYEQTGGTINGGDDVISTQSQTNGISYSTGDVYDFSGGTMNGGDDVITVFASGTSEARVTGDVMISDAGGAGGTIVGGNDTLFGGLADDILVGDVHSNDDATVSVTGGDDILYGGAGDDELYGEIHLGTLSGVIGGDDYLYGGLGDDYLSGQYGNDFLFGGLGNDTIIGGSGTDWVSYMDIATGVTVDLSDTGAQDTIGAGTDTISSVENLQGSNSDDTLWGNASANSIDGSLGDDVINGNDGDDLISGGFGNDTISGQGDNDIIDGGFGDDDLYGGSGDDIIIGGDGEDTVNYTDRLAGTDLTITLRTASAQTVTGIEQDTLLTIEHIESGEGNDSLKGSNGDNNISGNGGDDVINGYGGDDGLAGGNGDDIMYGSDGNDLVFGNAGDDKLRGNNGDDILVGGDGIDDMNGGSGADQLYGVDGDDNMNGGTGNDIIEGGAGDDVVRGGTGVDIFVFQAGSEIDRVRDWEDGTDLIDLSDYGFADKATALTFFSQVGSNVRFINGGDQLVIEGETLADITDADILI